MNLFVLLILEGSKSLTYALINLSKQVSHGYFYIHYVIVTFVNISSKCLNKAGMSLQPHMSNRRYLGREEEVVYFLKLFITNVEIIKVAVEIIMETLTDLLIYTMPMEFSFSTKLKIWELFI